VRSALAGLAIGAAAGSVPFAWVLYRAVTGRDLREEGSGNPGTTNLARRAGTLWGAAALALDAGKGAAAVLLAEAYAGGGAALAAAVGAVIGHVYSPWLLGRGGKGVAPAAGAFAVVAPAATAVAASIFAIVGRCDALRVLGFGGSGRGAPLALSSSDRIDERPRRLWRSVSRCVASSREL
jgi:glycerol-3-phosphate acyltransferase PlsY